MADQRLSYLGKAVVEAMKCQHGSCEGTNFNVSMGACKRLLHTPPSGYHRDKRIDKDDETTHSDYLPEAMYECISKAEAWMTLTSLGPPDGKFLRAISRGIADLHAKDKPIIIRILLSNVPGTPTDDKALLKELVKDLPESTKVKIWVAAYRKGSTSWNHSKIIASDDKYLITGGHNLWDAHYLQKDPTRDLTAEYEGDIAVDGHLFANQMWKFVIEDTSRSGEMKDAVPIIRNRSSMCKYPSTLEDYPPMYEPKSKESLQSQGDTPLVSLGRYGELFDNARNASDAGILAMFKAAKVSIKCCIQDLGSVCFQWPPGTDRFAHLPGLEWPHAYMQEIGKAICERGVTVQILLSAPHAVPGGSAGNSDYYGYGWTVAHVAEQFVKEMQIAMPEKDSEELLACCDRLQMCYMKGTKGESDYCRQNGKVGNHAKNVIVDDQAYLIGSQNLYDCNLAEWGVLVDDADQCRRFVAEYWQPLWKCSFEDAPRDYSWNQVINSSVGCENGKLPNASGSYKNCKGPYTMCPKCQMWFCTYHHNVNMSDGIMSFGGHVCRAEIKCENEKLRNASGSLTNCEGPTFPCPHCKMSLCSYHYKVNKNDGLLSFGGHVCPKC
eukprot:gnl/TRDRNA2_/TRDRNA2_65371_c0_seq1.p1 gnl/TRDRNA2_/TRDRNA2_65371_c0~~gnl/TRDRNA2_/TRDRNA2_65371_c0_seq1.p1  ORF type:complete len:609 (+),score=82.20 gnl/TRDRNA2_/TRDRNA2_65371_c0_seq1:69-1895(+)